MYYLGIHYINLFFTYNYFENNDYQKKKNEDSKIKGSTQGYASGLNLSPLSFADLLLLFFPVTHFRSSGNFFYPESCVYISPNVPSHSNSNLYLDLSILYLFFYLIKISFFTLKCFPVPEFKTKTKNEESKIRSQP